MRLAKVHGVVDVLDGVENTISGPAVTFQVNPLVAARVWFHPEEIAVDASAVLEGEPAATPVVINDRVYPIRVRFPDQNRAIARSDDQHAAGERIRPYGNARFIGPLGIRTGRNRNPARELCSEWYRSRDGWKAWTWEAALPRSKKQ